MKIILRSQLNHIPAYIEEEHIRLPKALSAFGFSLCEKGKNIVGQNPSRHLWENPEVTLQYDTLEDFLDASSEYYSVRYDGERDENGTMIWTLLNDPYPC